MAKENLLTDFQLKGLDLLIEFKRINPDFIDAIAHVANAVVQVAGAVAVVTAVVAGAEETSGKLGASAGKGVSLEDLIKLRQEAVEKSKH